MWLHVIGYKFTGDSEESTAFFSVEEWAKEVPFNKGKVKVKISLLQAM
jgi:hypothetical protein